MLALLFAAALLQVAPEPTQTEPAKTETATPALRDNGLPKTDYELVAWCHGALAGQLELDPIAKADMEKIEGKAKVGARAKADAEIEAERRQYLKDYEHALAAAEAASPSAIHGNGVRAEEQGYKLWTATRNKEPIWRMLDWGMWDPNDAGCGEAAKRLYDKSKLFGLALKNSDEDTGKSDEAANKTQATPTLVADPKIDRDAIAERLTGTIGRPETPGAATLLGGGATKLPEEAAAETAPIASTSAPAGATYAKAEPQAAAEAPAQAAPARKPIRTAAKAARTKPKAKTAEQVRATLENAAPAPVTADAPAGDKPADPPVLRGPQ